MSESSRKAPVEASPVVHSTAFDRAMQAASALCLEGEAQCQASSSDQLALHDASTAAVELQQHLASLRILLRQRHRHSASDLHGVEPSSSTLPVAEGNSFLRAGRRSTDVFVTVDSISSQTVEKVTSVITTDSSSTVAADDGSAGKEKGSECPSVATVSLQVATAGSSRVTTPAPRTAFQLAMLMRELVDDAELLLAEAVASPSHPSNAAIASTRKDDQGQARARREQTTSEAKVVDISEFAPLVATRSHHSSCLSDKDNEVTMEGPRQATTHETAFPQPCHVATTDAARPTSTDDRGTMTTLDTTTGGATSGGESSGASSPRVARSRIVHIDPRAADFPVSSAPPGLLQQQQQQQLRRFSAGSLSNDPLDDGGAASPYFGSGGSNRVSQSWLCGSVSFAPSATFQPDEDNCVSRGTMTRFTTTVSSGTQCILIGGKQ